MLNLSGRFRDKEPAQNINTAIIVIVIWNVYPFGAFDVTVSLTILI